MNFRQIRQEEINRQQDEGEKNVHPGEVEHIFPLFGTRRLGVVFIGDKTGHGGDDGAQTADIHPGDEGIVGGGEFRKEDCRGDVADKLAGQKGDNDFPAQKEGLQGLPDKRDAPQVADEDKEAHKGQKEVIIQPLQDVLLEEKEPHQNDEEGSPMGGHTEYRQQAQQEQHPQHEEAGFFRNGPVFLRLLFFCCQGAFALKIAEYIEEEIGDRHIGHRYGEKFLHAHAGNGIEKEVLGVAHRGQHAAQIGGDGLQHDNGDHLFPEVRPLQQQDGEGDEGDEGHIVGDEHGGKEAQHDQGGGKLPHFSGPGQKEVCHAVKNPQLLEAAHDRHQAEQEHQHPHIAIFQIPCIRRDEEGRKKGQTARYAEDGFFFEKSNTFLFHNSNPFLTKNLFFLNDVHYKTDESRMQDLFCLRKGKVRVKIKKYGKEDLHEFE